MNIPRRKFLVAVARATVLACVLCLAFALGAQAESQKLTVRVMTRNMDAGTDLLYVAGASDLNGFVAGVLKTVAEVQASNLPGRAAQLAVEIAEAKPDLIALQEVTTWHFETASGTVTFDQLNLLQDALDAAGLYYEVAVKQQLTDIPVEIPGVLSLRFTDHDVILVRSDLPPGHLEVLGTETHLYDHLLPFPTPFGPIPSLRGWIAADIRIRGARVKVADTHLESPVPGENFDQTALLQLAQANELVTALEQTDLPVILAGDFNSDAEPTWLGPDKTVTAWFIVGKGYTDAWRALTPARDHGYTWALFLEDQASAPPFVLPTTPFERIDLIFSRGPIPLSVEQTGTGPGAGGVYASDHVGVVATFDLENHRPVVPVRGR